MEDVWNAVEHHYADNNGVKLHYVTLGEGEPVVFVHGFPDFWYSWRHQMAALASLFKVIAIDMRAYNLSDKPEGIDNYKMDFLLGDIAAADADLAALAELADQTHHHQAAFHLKQTQAMRAQGIGEFEEAERLASEAFALRRESAESMFPFDFLALYGHEFPSVEAFVAHYRLLRGPCLSPAA